MELSLSDYDKIIINSSGGKDSLCAIFEICRQAKEQSYNFENIVVSHQDLGKMEWEGTKELASKQAELFGLRIMFSKRKDKNGYEENLLEYILRRGKFPSNKQRFCTSDFKRGPGQRVVTELTKGIPKSKILYVFGFRAEESASRKKKEVYILNKNLTTKSREVFDYLPIHDWNINKVWETIKGNGLPYHYAYDLGMPRLSCAFCIFSPLDALVIAGINNPKLLDEYIEIEKTINHSFKKDLSLESVRQKINDGYIPKSVNNWVM